MEETKQDIQDAFRAATAAVDALEKTIRTYYNTPYENTPLDKYIRIGVPSNYIRTRNHFVYEYKLRELISSQIHRDSIAYGLMQSDLHNLIINRLNIWGIVQTLFLKTAIINLVSIQEAYISCSLSTLHNFCKVGTAVCKYNGNCKTYSKSPKGLRGYRDIIKYFEETIGFGNSEVVEELLKLNEIRNRVHISLIDESEFNSKHYSLANYNRAVMCLKFLKENLLERVEIFKSNQSNSCKVLPF